MGLNCGIVGLPNVGKSTLFNALTRTQEAQAANYPFCTIEPNIGQVEVPDPRLAILGDLASSKVIIPTRISFVDIAGLVSGAAQGEGLGNQFLSNIREVDAICHVLRCFDDENVTHVNNAVDPAGDYEIVETELILADMDSLQKQEEKLIKKARGNDKDAKKLLAQIATIMPVLEEGKPARSIDMDMDEIKQLQLLTAKPLILVCNVGEEDIEKGNRYSQAVKALADDIHVPVINICANIESQLSQLQDAQDRAEMLEGLGIETAGLDLLIRASYEKLGLITFFTAGPKEARAWVIRKNSTAQEGAGTIHTDFARGFIAAEVIAYQDYVDVAGEANARTQGKLRLEGRNYIMQDGDVTHFRFNV